MGVIIRFKYYQLVTLSLTRERPIQSQYQIKIGYVLALFTPQFAITDVLTS